MSKVTAFRDDDAGAVTIDWVALTSGILLLGMMIVYAIFNGGVSSLVTNINDTLDMSDSTTGLETLTEGTGKASEKGCQRSGIFQVCIGVN